MTPADAEALRERAVRLPPGAVVGAFTLVVPHRLLTATDFDSLLAAAGSAGGFDANNAGIRIESALRRLEGCHAVPQGTWSFHGTTLDAVMAEVCRVLRTPLAALAQPPAAAGEQPC